jgi:hypothetical protein
MLLLHHVIKLLIYKIFQMKTINKISIGLLSLFISSSSFAQLKVDNSGNTYVKYGTFSPGNDASVFLGDNNHYIKSKFGYGVVIGTGNTDVIKLPQWSGKVGILMEPSYTLDVNGYIRGYNLIPSDKRLKTNINGLTDKANLLSKVKGFSYDYNFVSNEKESKNELNGKTHFGFIAQDLQKIYPELVHTDNSGYLSVDYISFIPLLVETVNEQSKKIEQLESQIQLATQISTIDSKSSSAFIKQNSPNPFNSSTKIEYLVPEGAGNAAIYFYDMQGAQKKVVKLNQKGESSITINGGEFTPGMYLYSLIIDDKLIDTKRMVLTQQ